MLEQVKVSCIIKEIKLDKRTLPRCRPKMGYVSRQVIDIKLSALVTEYRAQKFADETGMQYVAPIPESVTRPMRYGENIKPLRSIWPSSN